ncbi:MAG: peptidase M64, partial [Paramuribaculum sp.]|nr:peptidase M64 [Paramuribaculum sp.]
MLSIRNTLIALAATALTASAADFDRHFSDSTLRLDYIFAGDASRQGVYLASSSKSAGWAGRRTRLDRMPLIGNGSVTVPDPATGDPLYTTTVS